MAGNSEGVSCRANLVKWEEREGGGNSRKGGGAVARKNYPLKHVYFTQGLVKNKKKPGDGGWLESSK
jgi:hypothetical protein